jgi:hypothetical protein
MTSKYRTRVFALAVLIASCSPQAVVPSPSPTASMTASPSPSPVPATAAPGLVALIPARISTDRRWYAMPDGLEQATVTFSVVFDADPTRGQPYVNVLKSAGGRPGADVVALQRRTGNEWTASLSLDRGYTPGEQTARVFERLSRTDPTSDPPTLEVAGSTSFLVTQPEYVVWTLDFEGDASSDAELANTAAIADGLRIPTSVFWNPRVWTTSQVSPERQDAMLSWTKGRLAKGDEVALHLHMWTDYVRAAGLVPRTAPSWAGRGDGYDVPMTAYSETEQKALIDHGLILMAAHGLPKPTSFRAGGDIGDAATLRAVAAAGFNADCTAVAKDYPPIGRIPYPWTLPAGAQPYRPSSTDANATGDLPLLEAPTIGGNTYAFTVQTIQPQIRANLALFATAGTVAAERRAITIVSHPGTIVAAERAAIEALLGAFGPLRYDADAGPVRFVTLAQLAQAYGR